MITPKLGILLFYFLKILPKNQKLIEQNQKGLITGSNKRILFLSSPRNPPLSLTLNIRIYIYTHTHMQQQASVTGCRRLWTVVVSWPCITVTGQTSPTMVVLLESWEAGKRLIIMQLTLSYSITVAAGYRCSRRGQFEEQFATRYREQHHPSTVLADDIDTRLPRTLVCSQPPTQEETFHDFESNDWRKDDTRYTNGAIRASVLISGRLLGLQILNVLI